MLLIIAGLLYMLIGSSRFWRHKFRPDSPNPLFNYCAGVIFAAGGLMVFVGMLEIQYPSPFVMLKFILILTLASLFMYPKIMQSMPVKS